MAMNEHIYEAQVIRDEEYLQTVEAAVMQCAMEIHQEPSTVNGHANRAALALAIFTNPGDTERFSRFFAWLALFNPTIRGQVFKAQEADKIRPDLIVGTDLRALIKNAWNVAANVQEGS